MGAQGKSKAGQGTAMGGRGPREVMPRAAVMQERARAGVRLREESRRRAAAGSRKATVCTAFLSRVRSTPRASSQSTPPPASELPTAITVQGRNANMLDACALPLSLSLIQAEGWPPPPLLLQTNVYQGPLEHLPRADLVCISLALPLTWSIDSAALQRPSQPLDVSRTSNELFDKASATMGA